MDLSHLQIKISKLIAIVLIKVWEHFNMNERNKKVIEIIICLRGELGHDFNIFIKIHGD